MKSVALLPAHGDPFCLKHFIVNYERVWHGEVDELHVLVSGQPDPGVGEYMQRVVEKVGGNYHGTLAPTLDHGVALRMLMDHVVAPHHGVNADVVMLIESDARVRHYGAVAQRVNRIASGSAEVIGTPRVSMATGLDEACRERWGRDYPTAADGAQGYGLWPCFVFVRADVLYYETDRNYGARGWLENEPIVGLDRLAGVDWAADTFGAAALQLRGRHEVTPDVQYKGPHGWEAWLDEGHDPPWFHVGSLSSWGGSGGLTVPIAELMHGCLLDTEMERLEWGHRIAWWERFLRTTRPDLPTPAFYYQENLLRMCEVMGIEQRHADHWTRVIDRLISWEE